MALIPIIVTAAKIAQTVYKHRKSIYAVVTAQDRYLSKAYRAGGYGKATNYGVRSGALAGSIIGTYIAPDSPGNDNAVQKQREQPPTGTPYKTRSGPAGRFSSGSRFRQRTYRKQRCSCPGKYQRSRNRF